MGEGLKRARRSAARTRSNTAVGPSLTDRATLDLVIAAAVAAVRQAKAEEAYERLTYRPNATYKQRINTEEKYAAAAEVAQRETCAAGKALADALDRVRGSK